MKRTKTKTLTLNREVLRRMNREVTAAQLARALGGERVDCGAGNVPENTETVRSKTCEL